MSKNDLTNELIKAIKKPLPRDSNSIVLRSKWLAFSCCRACLDTKDLFYKIFDIQPMRNRDQNLIFEINMLMISKALETTKIRFINEFLEKDKDDLDKFFGDYVESPALDIIVQLHEEERTVDDIISPYEAYIFLRSEYQDEAKFDVSKKEGQSEFTENLHKKIRVWQGIDDETKTKEQHFAKRVKKIFQEIEEDKITSFAKKFVSIQGLLLSMDAFAAVDQEKINKNIYNLLDDHSKNNNHP